MTQTSNSDLLARNLVLVALAIAAALVASRPGDAFALDCRGPCGPDSVHIGNGWDTDDCWKKFGPTAHLFGRCYKCPPNSTAVKEHESGGGYAVCRCNIPEPDGKPKDIVTGCCPEPVAAKPSDGCCSPPTENACTAPTECPVKCGDGCCSKGETPCNCKDDCKGKGQPTDGCCDEPTETCASAPVDCGECRCTLPPDPLATDKALVFPEAKGQGEIELRGFKLGVEASLEGKVTKKNKTSSESCDSELEVSGGGKLCAKVGFDSYCVGGSVSGSGKCSMETKCVRPPQYECDPGSECCGYGGSIELSISRGGEYTWDGKLFGECKLGYEVAGGGGGGGEGSSGAKCACPKRASAASAKLSLSGGGGCEFKLFSFKASTGFKMTGCASFTRRMENGCKGASNRNEVGAAIKAEFEGVKVGWFEVKAHAIGVEVGSCQ
jgi:hypothetical protein